VTDIRQPGGAWKKKFRGALNVAFNDGSLELLTTDYFSSGQAFSKLAPPSLGQTFEVRVQQLIEQARMEDWLLDLVAAAHERRPSNPDLRAIAEELGLTPAGRVDAPIGKTLESVLEENAAFINPAVFRDRLAALEGCVCFVDVPGGGGTGFLVGKDLVLTNDHVVAPVTSRAVSRQDVKCRFDYKQAIDGTTVEQKLEVGLLDSTEWIVDSRPPSASDSNPALGNPGPEEFDYALVRLAEAVGELPVGGDTVDAEAEPRGWISTSITPAAPVKGNQVFLLQHPRREPLQLAIGEVAAFNGDGTRLRHTANSKDGSSGSPCLNAELELVALHHAHDPAYPPQWNQAVPFPLIQQLWKQNGIAVG
jgi:hypothetical protein